MKIIFVLLCVFVVASCKKETVTEKQKFKTVILQMEAVNKAGNSTFYLQQVVK